MQRIVSFIVLVIAAIAVAVSSASRVDASSSGESDVLGIGPTDATVVWSGDDPATVIVSYGADDTPTVGALLAANPALAPRLLVGSTDEATFAGSLTEVRFYSRALPSAEIEAKMFDTLVPSEEHALVGYYPMRGFRGVLGLPFRQTPAPLPQGGLADQSAEGRLLAASAAVADASGSGNHAAWNSRGAVYVGFEPTPLIRTCPHLVSPNVMHHTLLGTTGCAEVSGVNFAPSQWAMCAFGDRLVSAVHVSDTAVSCCAPMGIAPSAPALEVSNAMSRTSDMKLPVHFLDMGLRFDGDVEVVAANGVGDDFVRSRDYGFAVMGWVFPEGEAVHVGELFDVPLPPPEVAGRRSLVANGRSQVFRLR